eukprot:TRINITY_DN17651_c0_g1_i2.p1 TRINITY_DN17651_c0_g1~~TRINITY_DN17651_c0_g1_i2.p1  ORF type:complete len:473 (+),score=68.36 TRINITY_DN17651_c0_g1_i2:74-1420(+)
MEFIGVKVDRSDHAKEHQQGVDSYFVDIAHASRLHRADHKLAALISSELTLAKLFMSGDQAETQHTEDGEHHIGLAAKGATDEVEVTIAMREKGVPPMQYFPDPPCIHRSPPSGQVDGFHRSIQEYWKKNATSLPCWPQVQENRRRIETFFEQWSNYNDGKKPRAYVSLSLNPVGTRSVPSHEDHFKTGGVVMPGQLVLIEAIEDIGGELFLKLNNGQGWLFDMKEGQVLMIEAQSLHVGWKWYRVVSDKCVETRHGPSSDSEMGTGWVLQPQEICPVSAHCRIFDREYVQLADGRGWVFMTNPSAPAHQRRQGDYVLQEIEEELASGQPGSSLINFPATLGVVEIGQWSYSVASDSVVTFGDSPFGRILRKGDIVMVSKRCYANGSLPNATNNSRLWLKLADSDFAWVPQTTTDGTTQMQLMDIVERFAASGKDQSMPSEDWMIGEV